MLKIIVQISFAVFATQTTWARTLPSEMTPLSISVPGAQIQGVRFLGKAGIPNSGPRILLSHGLGSNYHEFEALAAQLISEGYDVYAFNFRGHGNNGERSNVLEYSRGDYRFERMAEFDFPAMVNYVSDGGRLKIIVIGHSMGGMVPRASLAAGFVNSSAISRLILLGSPSTFDHSSLPWDFLHMPQMHEMPLWMNSGDQPILSKSLAEAMQGQIESSQGGIFMRLLMSLSAPLRAAFMPAVLREENFSDADDWQARAISVNVPRDIYRSFNLFRIRGFEYANSKIDVPVLHIMGSDDQLAPWQNTVQKTRIQSESHGSWLVLLKRVSHLDLVASRVVSTYLPLVKRFMQSPESLGEKNSAVLEMALPCRLRL
jgi:pimeloyl-ACP methyl ester carboxylesterase